MKVGFTAGNFDLLHPDYIYTFEEAKRHCDNFIVFLHRSLIPYSQYKEQIGNVANLLKTQKRNIK